MNILAIGDVIVDIIYDEKSIIYYNGGSAFNVAYHLANYTDANISVMGRCGKDYISQSIIEYLNQLNINTDLIIQEENIFTNQIFMKMDGSECVYDIMCPNCNKLLWQQNKSFSDSIAQNLNYFDKIILDKLDPDFIKVSKNLTNKTFVSYCDIDDTSIDENISIDELKNLITLINQIDCVQINGDTFKVIKRILNLNEQDDILNYLKNSIIAITNGKNGTTVYINSDNTQKYLIKNIIQKQVDNTGAGDAFMSSLVISTYKHDDEIIIDLNKLQTISNQIVSEVLSTIGARPNNKPLKIKKSETQCDVCGRDL